MAKIIGPLMSLAASGSFGKMLTFRQTRHGSIAQLPPIPSGPPSINQSFERERFAAALHAWRGLDQPTKDAWHGRGTIFKRQPVILFCSEYLQQRCSPPDLPQLPSISGI